MGEKERKNGEKGGGETAPFPTADLHRDEARQKRTDGRTDGRMDGRTDGRAGGDVSRSARRGNERIRAEVGEHERRDGGPSGIAFEPRRAQPPLVCISSRRQATRGVYATVRMYVCTYSFFLSPGYRFKARRDADLI